jgi:hypothetical protein
VTKPILRVERLKAVALIDLTPDKQALRMELQTGSSTNAKKSFSPAKAYRSEVLTLF